MTNARCKFCVFGKCSQIFRECVPTSRNACISMRKREKVGKPNTASDRKFCYSLESKSFWILVQKEKGGTQEIFYVFVCLETFNTRLWNIKHISMLVFHLFKASSSRPFPLFSWKQMTPTRDPRNLASRLNLSTATLPDTKTCMDAGSELDGLQV